MRAVVAGMVLVLAGVARGEHRGLPVLDVLPQSLHRGGAQTFDAAQDPRGILYFGNLSGVITYDGAWWSTISLPNESAVFAVESDAAGVVAAGGVGELGYLVAAPDGTLGYQSLVDQLPPLARDVGEVRGVCTTGRGFVFATERFTIEWNGGAPRVIEQHLHGGGPSRCGVIDGVIHLWGGDGLHRVERGRVVPAALAGMRIDAAVGSNGRTIVAAREGGLLAIAGGAAEPFGEEASRWLQGKLVTDACALGDGRLAFATRESGLLILTRDGAIDEILDATAGLPDDVLLCVLPDREGAVWLAYHGPLVRVDLTSPVTILDQRRGLRGATNSITRDGRRLWLTTSHGLFVMEDGRHDVQRVANLGATAWSALPLDGQLLVATSDGIHRLEKDTVRERIAGTAGLTVYQMVHSEADPSTVWLGMREGIGSLRREGGAWRYAGTIEGSPRYARPLLEHDGVLWAGTVFNGMARLGRDGKIARFGSGETSPFVIDDRVAFVQHPGRLFHVDARDDLVPDPDLGHISGHRFFHVVQDGSGNVWINSDPPRIVKRSGGRFAREAQPLSGIGVDIQLLRYEDGAMWFGAADGLYRYAPRATESAIAQPAPLIRRVVAGTGDTLFSDGISTGSGATALRYAFRRLRIEFAPASYRAGVAYQYRLDPIDSAWSEWSPNPFIDYTHLDEGRYTFRLRSRGATGATSEEAQWSFTVHPPWYRTPWMILLGLIAAAGIVALIVKLRTRALRRQAERLRGLVDERTHELAKTVDLLEEANQHLERLSLLDELTGIPNRRYFDRALAQTWEAAAQLAQPLSLILLDLDHFKLLNDAKGHPAGDASLVQVARLLAQRIRRSGDLAARGQDVAARIGGEEFAVLLSNTDAEGATRIAETLRASIQEMVIAFESAALKVTVSCGVATTTPATGNAPELLVRRADRALYDAKAAGRNCVREAA